MKVWVFNPLPTVLEFDKSMTHEDWERLRQEALSNVESIINKFCKEEVPEPQMKSKAGIENEFPESRVIIIWCPVKALADFRKFGSIHKPRIYVDRYEFTVDPRYDYKEVRNYILNWREKK